MHPQVTTAQPITQPQNTDTFGLQYHREPLSVEYQKLVIDEDGLKTDFYFRFCGWIIVTKTRTYDFLGEKRTETYEDLVIDKTARIMNEALANKLYYDIRPLISKLTTTSILNKESIYKSYNAQMVTKILMFARICREKSNIYELDRNYIPDIVTYLCGFSNMTKKALDGFMTKYNTQSIQTATLVKQGLEGQAQPQQQGLLDKINIFKR